MKRVPVNMAGEMPPELGGQGADDAERYAALLADADDGSVVGSVAGSDTEYSTPVGPKATGAPTEGGSTRKPGFQMSTTTLVPAFVERSSDYASHFGMSDKTIADVAEALLLAAFITRASSYGRGVYSGSGGSGSVSSVNNEDADAFDEEY